jgi:hypothetical protein
VSRAALVALLALPWLSGATAAAQPADQAPPLTYGVYLDVAYLADLESPDTDVFRNRGTTPRLDAAVLDMAAVWLAKAPAPSARFGFQLTAHAGEDAKTFGFSPTAPQVSGSDWLLHLGPTNVTYLAPIGSGLTVQGGIFNSVIGYDSLYAKDNFSYTRPWGADDTPYLMLGVNASYGLTRALTATVVLTNGYFHLAHANDAPSVGGRLVYKATEAVSLTQAVLIGSHQRNTAVPFWRYLSDTIVERRTKRLVLAIEYQAGRERVEAFGEPEAVWMSAQIPVHWTVHGGWSITVRPEWAWDRDGRWITGRLGAGTSVAAFTSTLEHRASLGPVNSALRIEHRFDRSQGAGGGFFDRDGGLTPRQHLLLVALLLTYERASGR